MSVIGEGNDMVSQRLHIRELFSFFLYRNCGVRIYVNDRIRIDDVLLDLEMLEAVRHRVQVRHCADCRVAAPRGCL